MLATVALPALQIVLTLVVGFLAWRAVQVAAEARSEAQAARSEAASARAAGAAAPSSGGIPPEALSRIEEQLRRLSAARAADAGEQHHAAPSERLMSEKADAYRGFLREIASENTHIGTGMTVQTSDAAEEALSRLRSVTVLMGSEEILRSLRNFSIIRGQRPSARWTEPAIMAYARLQVCLVQAIRRDLDTTSEPLSPEETWASMSTGTADPAFRLAMLTPISEVLHHAGQDLSLYDLREEPTALAQRSAASARSASSASSAQRAQTGPIAPIEQPIAAEPTVAPMAAPVAERAAEPVATAIQAEPVAYHQRINRPEPADYGTPGRSSASSAPSTGVPEATPASTTAAAAAPSPASPTPGPTSSYGSTDPAPSHVTASASPRSSTAQIPPTEATIPDTVSSPTPTAPGASARRPVHAPGRDAQVGGHVPDGEAVRLLALLHDCVGFLGRARCWLRAGCRRGALRHPRATRPEPARRARAGGREARGDRRGRRWLLVGPGRWRPPPVGSSPVRAGESVRPGAVRLLR